MKLHMLKSKIHNAIVTSGDLEYEGSITIDKELLEMADMLANEKVLVVNNNNGERFETYIIEGTRGLREIQLNGAAARRVQRGDGVIIVAYVEVDAEEAAFHRPVVVLVDEHNRVREQRPA